MVGRRIASLTSSATRAGAARFLKPGLPQRGRAVSALFWDLGAVGRTRGDAVFLRCAPLLRLTRCGVAGCG